MEAEVQFVETRKGTPSLLVKKGERENSPVWCCTNKLCKCRAVLDKEKTLIEIIGQHIDFCKKLTERETERNACRVSVKRKADESLNCRPMKIIRKELRASSFKNLQASDIRLVRRSMYRQRQKVVPAIPRSRAETTAYLFKVQENLLTNKGEKFVYIKEDGFIMLTTESNLKLCLGQGLRAQEKSGNNLPFPDSSLETAKSTWESQTSDLPCTIHGCIYGHNIPLAFFPLPGKKETTYTKMFELLKEKLPVDLKPDCIFIDFETAAHKAARAVLQCGTKGCKFHHSQSLFRHIQSCPTLKNVYSEPTLTDANGLFVVHEARDWLVRFLWLSSLPHGEKRLAVYGQLTFGAM
ncbi:ATP synthase subunit delta [Frankliniella fusca]|uniref:ATP synthase subunit delta n=1 Tax=Frankliniella fusca TaxID=407009 RepID=A0AAE1I1E7_9NEOP|nr:ATP synthase subunit delta [Frankliniella fusca]